MFSKTAEYYDALYAFKNYQEACHKLDHHIRLIRPGAKTLLDVACGTGKHISYLQDHYEVHGLDINRDLLRIAGKRCPDVPFHAEDMSDFDLGLTFDVVICLFSSIGYVRTKENLRKSIQCMANHVASGGLLIVEPWFTPESFWPEHVVLNVYDQPGLKIAWMYAHEKKDNTSVLDIQYMVGTVKGIETFTEKHVLGLWTHQEYLDAFESAGIQVHYDEKGLFGRGMYTGEKKDNL
jgi:SAM-dependent methyltransferase